MPRRKLSEGEDGINFKEVRSPNTIFKSEKSSPKKMEGINYEENVKEARPFFS